MSEDVIWTGWIPTNKGEIDFNYIELPDFIKSQKNVSYQASLKKRTYEYLDVSYLSDSYRYKQYLKKNTKKQTETKINADISFEKHTNNIGGKIKITYVDFITIESDFVINPNGVIEFYTFEVSTNIQDFVKEIKTLIYVLVKTIVHGDAHHHQKIDIALDIVEGKFDAKVVSKSFLNYIKLAEKNTKKTNNCESILRNENIVYEIEGYMTYFESFKELFEDAQIEKDIKFAKNVMNSLKNTVAKRRNKEVFSSSIITTTIAFFGILISTNILFNGFWTPQCNDIICFFSEQNRYYYFVGTFALILASFFMVVNCKLKSHIYYYHYERFEFLRLLRNSNFKNLNWYGKSLKMIPLVLILVGILLFVYKYKTIILNNGN